MYINLKKLELPLYCVDIKDFVYYRFTDNNHILKFDLRQVIKYSPPYFNETETDFKNYVRTFLKHKYIQQLTFEEFRNCIDYALDFIMNNEAEPRITITPEEIKTNKEMLNKPEEFYKTIQHEF